MDKAATKEFMLNIVRQIVPTLDPAVMQEILQESRASEQHWDSIGGLLDPTRYRDMLYDGSFKHAQGQREIVEHLIGILHAVNKLDKVSAQYRVYHGESS